MFEFEKEVDRLGYKEYNHFGKTPEHELKWSMPSIRGHKQVNTATNRELFLHHINANNPLPVKNKRRIKPKTNNIFVEDLHWTMFRTSPTQQKLEAQQELNKFVATHAAWKYTLSRLFCFIDKLHEHHISKIKRGGKEVKKLQNIEKKQMNIFILPETATLMDPMNDIPVVWSKKSRVEDRRLCGRPFEKGRLFESKTFDIALFEMWKRQLRKLSELPHTTRQKLFRIAALSHLTSAESAMAFGKMFSTKKTSQQQERSNIRCSAEICGFPKKPLTDFKVFLSHVENFDMFACAHYTKMLWLGYSPGTAEAHVTSVRKLHNLICASKWETHWKTTKTAGEKVFHNSAVKADAIPTKIAKSVIDANLRSMRPTLVALARIMIIAVTFMLRFSEVVNLRWSQIKRTPEFIFISIFQGKSTVKDRMKLHIRIPAKVKPYGQSIQQVLDDCKREHPTSLFVFHSKIECDWPISESWMTTNWNMLTANIKEAFPGFEKFVWTTHCWRATGINNLRQLDVDHEVCLSLARHVRSDTNRGYVRMNAQMTIEWEKLTENDYSFLLPKSAAKERKRWGKKRPRVNQ